MNKILANTGFSAMIAFVVGLCSPAIAYDFGLAPIVVEVDGKVQIQTINMLTLMPGKTVEISVGDNVVAMPSAKVKPASKRAGVAKMSGYQLKDGELNLLFDKAQNRGLINWRAPDVPGFYPLRIVRDSDGASVALQVFVLRPASQIKNEFLNNYRIGNYPSALRGLSSYQAPKGFIEISPSLLTTPVSPHFTLGQFLCKQQSGYPKYLVLQPKLIEKLELLLSEVNQEGISANSFHVMSGYRTPFYNRAIGNVKNSRHIYGGAADVFIDETGNTNMDDLNQDGVINIQDAELLYQMADKLASRLKRPDLIGGVGLYPANAVHGPFVHVDVRGTRARWGHR